RAFLISRLSFWQRGESSSSLAFSRKASSPPRRSTVFSAWALMRRRTLRCSWSEISVTSHRLGRKVRLLLFSAWLRNCPDMGSLPVNSHRRVIEVSFCRPTRIGGHIGARGPFYTRRCGRQDMRGGGCSVPVRTGLGPILYHSGLMSPRHTIDAKAASLAWRGKCRRRRRRG